MQRISIITPSYNQVEYIEETICSVLSQNYPSLEYFIVDGASQDGSADVVQKYQKQLTWWISEPDKGQSNAINKGVRKSTGQVINWLNSDDYYEPCVLYEINDLFSLKSTQAVCGRSRLFDKNGNHNISKGTDIYYNNLPKTIGWARIDQPETFFSKYAWDKVGLLNEQLDFCMDREWWIRYLYHFGLSGIVKTDKVLVNFRLHETSKTTTSQTKFQAEHHSLFYQMGTVANNNRACEFLSTHLGVNKELETSISSWTNKELAAKSFNYYLLKTANEHYAQDNNEFAKELLSEIEESWLAPEDYRLFNSLRIKVRLPLSVIHFFRSKHDKN